VTNENFDAYEQVEVTIPTLKDQENRINLNYTHDLKHSDFTSQMVKGTASFPNCQFEVEIASTTTEQNYGLMYRTTLALNKGMLFVYSKEQILRFWMLNTYIPLDIIFINNEKVVVGVETMVPEPQKRGESLTIHASKVPAKYALEVNSGIVAQCGIRPGVLVTLNY
jgi:uncharacterized membrane protein (UPF0127 family)